MLNQGRVNMYGLNKEQFEAASYIAESTNTSVEHLLLSKIIDDGHIDRPECIIMLDALLAVSETTLSDELERFGNEFLETANQHWLLSTESNYTCDRDIILKEECN